MLGAGRVFGPHRVGAQLEGLVQDPHRVGDAVRPEDPAGAEHRPTVAG